MKIVFTGISDVYGVPFRVAIIPPGNANRPGMTQGRLLTNGVYTTSTVHETANTARGANAEMHRAFVFGGGGSEGVSFHAVVDDHEIIQLLPLDEVAWHAGDGAHGPGNSTSIATETCVNIDGDWQRTLQNLAKWQAFLLQNGGLSVEDMVQHNHWSGKDCPHVLRSNGGVEWAALVDTVGKLLIPQPVPDTYTDPATGKTISHGFWQEYQTTGGLQRYGHILSNEESGDAFPWNVLPELSGYTCQLLERDAFAWKMGSPVVHVRIGAIIEALAAQKG